MANTSLYSLARAICQVHAIGSGAEPWHGPPVGFCEPCLVEAMGRWSDVARLVAEAVRRGDEAQVQLRGVRECLTRVGLERGCLPATHESEEVVTLAMRIAAEVRRLASRRD